MTNTNGRLAVADILTPLFFGTGLEARTKRTTMSQGLWIAKKMTLLRRPERRKTEGLLLLGRGILLLTMLSPVLQAQPQKLSDQEPKYPVGLPIARPSRQTYERVWDAAFPNESDHGSPLRFSLVLRFLPSFEPESQIVIRCEKSETGATSVDYAKATTSAVEVTYRDFLGERSPDVQAVAMKMGVKRVSFAATPGASRKWLEGFLRALASSAAGIEKRAFNGGVILDATEYRLQYTEEFNSLSFDFVGSPGGREHPNDLPVVKWMNATRRTIEDLAKQHEGDK